jgi:heme/copper-type cytochrome/quinol oxidase subunit 2
MAPDPMKMISIMPVIMILFMAVFFGWFYALGTNLQKRLPGSVKMNLTKFKIFLAVPIIYIAFICVFMYSMFYHFSATNKPTEIGLLALIIPAHLFSMFCIFYCLYFNAKAFKAVELQRPVSFGDFAGEFFLLWFYPVGVWIIQPRLNKLFEKNNDMPTDLLSN